MCTFCAVPLKKSSASVCECVVGMCVCVRERGDGRERE